MSIPEQERRRPLHFTSNYGVYSALDRHGRRWLITADRTGWLLTFMNPGEQTPTLVSVHPTLREATIAASG